jgi:SSS family solute:Na+ symporter
MPEWFSLDSVSTLTLSAVAVYLVTIAAVGLVSGRRTKGETAYFLADRKLGPLTASATLSATVVGGSATILVIGQVFERGLPAVWIDLAGGIGLIVLGALLAGRVRRLGCYTLPEIAGMFYGGGVRNIAAALVVAAEVAWVGLLLKACSALLAPALHWEPLPILLTVGGVFILYTMVGGQFAVARTDVLQLGLMVIGIVSAAVILLAGAAGWHQLPEGRISFPTGPGFPPDVLLPLILVSGLPHLVGSDIYGKLLSARDESVARTAAFTAGFLKILFGLAAGILGLAALGLLPGDIPGDEILSTMITRCLPPPAAAALIVAFLATLVSSADSVLLTASTVISRDLLRMKGAAVGRAASLGVGLAGILLASLFPDLLGIFFFAYTLFSAGLTVPVLFGFWRERLRLTKAGASASMLGGAATVIVAQAAGWGPDQIVAGGLGISCALLFLVSFLTHGSGK